MKQVKLIIAGAGERGKGYGEYALHNPRQAKVVGVAEPREFHRAKTCARHGIPQSNAFADWKEMVKRDKFADAVIIATQDTMHVEPAIAFAAKGYHILLEKPMAPTARDCRRIARAATASGVIFGVCHVLRYTAYTQRLKQMIDKGLLGDIVTVQHLEPVGYWHQAHSFVRGNWGNELRSSPMLLAKSCHDLDWIRHIMGVPCVSVVSFGALKHFRKEERPKGAGRRCLACAIEHTCPYSAKRLYLGQVKCGSTEWPTSVITEKPSVKTVTEALLTGPYGRCVYAIDNDVVDNQVVSMQFAGNRTATFTMTAFTPLSGRKTHICGTRGHVHGDSRYLTHFDFLTNKTTTIDTEATDASVLGGHGGGDVGIMKAFVAAVGNNDRSMILSGPDVSLETHLMVFAAEMSRKENRIVRMSEV